MNIDLNCDLGEGYPFDAELMTLISSANISCGFHAGDVSSVFSALRNAQKLGVRVGAHPSFIDREQFGRRELNLDPEVIVRDCVYQVGAFSALADLVPIEIAYLKPHGALYNMACREDRYAHPVVEVACRFGLAVVGLPNSRLQLACKDRCDFIAEGFADRRYRADGSLVPRTAPDAFVSSPEEAVRQAETLIRERNVRSLCVHGDNPEALTFVRELRAALMRQGFAIRPG